MKEYRTSDLSLDDLLQDVKRHAGQLHFILRELKTRGAQQSGHEIIRSYSNVMEAIARYAVTSPEGNPFLKSDGSLCAAGSREEAELIAKSINEPTGSYLANPRAVVKELIPEGLPIPAPKFKEGDKIIARAERYREECPVETREGEIMAAHWVWFAPGEESGWRYDIKFRIGFPFEEGEGEAYEYAEYRELVLPDGITYEHVCHHAPKG